MPRRPTPRRQRHRRTIVVDAAYRHAFEAGGLILAATMRTRATLRALPGD